jgi:7-dehydrocholesterol reductase
MFAWLRQRQEFRKSEGKCKVWGEEPDYIVAHYTTEDGKERSSLLLASGWWGLARLVTLTFNI